MSEAEMMQEWEEELAMEGQTRDGFRVTDDGGAAWCVRKIREAQDECDQMIMWYSAQIEKAKARMNATVERMTAYLREYGETVPARETKTQRSYTIPGGKMIWKKEHTEYRHDDAVVLEGLKRDGRTEYIKTVEKLDWAGLKKEISVTGELPDGVTMETVPEEFTVKIEEA
jgi:phage host-nuclease inhibitor protein Gam